MSDPATGEATRLLRELGAGDADAAGRLLPLVYDELRSLAARYLRRERAGHTLQATALVHEAFLRLIEQREIGWRDRSQFVGVAAQAMRRVLVNHAKRRRRLKRGSGAAHVSLDETPTLGDERSARLLELDAAIERLNAMDPRQARIVELRFYGGLTIEETAEVLGLSHATIEREWRTARAWLRRETEAS